MTPRMWLASSLLSGVLAGAPLAVNLAAPDTTPAPDFAVSLAVAARAGCMGDDVAKITLATAVGLAESDNMGGWSAVGDTTITDDVWGPSYGGWQIRSLWADQGTGRTRDASQLLDPAFNTASMCTVSGDGTDWSPWTTYRTGSYLTRMARAEAAARTALTLPVTTPGQAISPAQQATDDGCQPTGKHAVYDVLNRLWCNTAVRAWLAVRKANPGNPTLDKADKFIFGDGPEQLPANAVRGTPGVRSSGGFTCPVVAGVTVGDGWGAARTGHTHQGVDVFGDADSPMVAPFDGSVSDVITDEAAGGLGGISLVVRRSDGAEVYLAHANTVTATNGQKVRAGDQVGTVGNSGNARGGPTHVHVQYYPPGSSDPQPAGATIGAACGQNTDPAADQ